MPDTAVGVPLLHRPVLGAIAVSPPLAVPQEPLTICAQLVPLSVHDPSPVPEHVAVAPPTNPTTTLLSDWVCERVDDVVVPLQLSQPRLVPEHDL